MLWLTRVHCSYGRLWEKSVWKSACWKLHVLFSNGTSREGEGGNKCFGPKHIRVIWCDYYIGAKLLLFLHNRQWKTFALWQWSFAHISATHSPFTINIVQVAHVSLPAMVSTLAGSPEAALGVRFLTRPFLSAMPDWALINMDCCAQRPCPPYCAVPTNANTLACKTSVLERLSWFTLTFTHFEHFCDEGLWTLMFTTMFWWDLLLVSSPISILVPVPFLAQFFDSPLRKEMSHERDSQEADFILIRLFWRSVKSKRYPWSQWLCLQHPASYDWLWLVVSVLFNHWIKGVEMGTEVILLLSHSLMPLPVL